MPVVAMPSSSRILRFFCCSYSVCCPGSCCSFGSSIPGLYPLLASCVRLAACHCMLFPTHLSNQTGNHWWPLYSTPSTILTFPDPRYYTFLHASKHGAFERNDIMEQVGILKTVQVGMPHRYGSADAVEPLERRWKTSFFRVPDAQPRWLYTTHLEGNEQADKKHHGSLSQAVLLYAAAHYPLWHAELEQPEMKPGGFGENFTVEGLAEDNVCVGDVYALGEAHIRVTGPRYPCWKIARRWQIAGLTDRVAACGRTGWYCCVLQEG